MDLDIRVTELNGKINLVEQRVEKLEDMTATIQNLTISVERMSLSVENMVKEQSKFSAQQEKLSKRLLEVEQAPYKDKATRYTEITKYVLTLILGGLVGYLMKSLLGI